MATMKHLTLIRHAKSSWANASLSDFDRPLNARGLSDAPRMGAALAAMPLPPIDRMLSSPALRARTTARSIAERLGWPEESITLEPRIYEATPGVLLELVRALDDSDDHVVLFGHNPGFEELARALDPEFVGDGEKFPTCGVAQLQLAVSAWREVGHGCASAARFVYPKQLA